MRKLQHSTALASIRADAKLRVSATSRVHTGEFTDGGVWVLSVTDDFAEFWSLTCHAPSFPTPLAAYVPEAATHLTSFEFASWLEAHL